MELEAEKRSCMDRLIGSCPETEFCVQCSDHLATALMCEKTDSNVNINDRPAVFGNFRSSLMGARNNFCHRQAKML